MTRPADESEQIFASAAELFGVLATPIRLRIISALCQGEKNVSQLLEEIDSLGEGGLVLGSAPRGDFMQPMHWWRSSHQVCVKTTPQC